MRVCAAEDGGSIVEKKLLTIQEAADLLNVSKTTFGKIRREAGLSEIMVGKRPRFIEAELLAALPRFQQGSAPVPPPLPKQEASPPAAEVQLCLTSTQVLRQIETATNRFDLARLRRVDPHGALSLLCAVVARTRDGQNVELVVDNGAVCHTLKSFHFFYHLESLGDGKVEWDREVLSAETFKDSNRLLPIRAIRARGGEKSLSDEFVESLKNQGFSQTLAQFASQVIAELAGNAMTHSDLNLSDRICFACAQRASLQGENRVILAIADLGKGLHRAVKEQPGCAHLSDPSALLEALRAHDDFWESRSTISLIDVVSVVAGNGGQMRVDSGDVGLVVDFQGQARMAARAPLAKVTGTRFGFVLRDREFERMKRGEANRLLQEAAAPLLTQFK